MDKTGRNGIRVGDILLPDWKKRYENLKKKHLKMLEILSKVKLNLTSLS